MGRGAILDPETSLHLVRALLHFLWQGAVIAGAIAVLLFLLRRKSADARYLLLLAAMAFMIACPPLTFFLLPKRAAPSPAVPPRPASSVADPIARSEHTSDENARPVAAEGPDVAGLAATPQAENGAVKPPMREAPAPATSASDRWQVYAPNLALVYAGCVATMLLRLIASLYGGQRLSKCSQPIADPQLLVAIARQVQRMGFTYTPAVAYCTRVAVPCVVGVLRPMLLLPLTITTGLTTEQVELLVGHELAHIRRCDHIVNLVQRLAEAFLFFHPAVWFISGRIRAERECCCDDRVVAAGGQRERYASSLVRMAEISFAENAATAGLMAALHATGEPSQLRQRVMRLIDGAQHNPLRLTRWSAMLVGAASLGLLLVPVSCSLPASRTAGSPTDEHELAMLRRELDADPASVNAAVERDWTRLHLAVASARADQLALLLSRGAEVNARAGRGWTALHFAARVNRTDIGQLLINAKADLDAPTVDGRTPLHVAAGSGVPPISTGQRTSEAMLRLLLGSGANPNLADQYGALPLHSAAQMGHAACVALLVNATADPNHRDNKGRSPLHVASSSHAAEPIQLLLSRGADPRAVDMAGWSALDHLGLQPGLPGPITPSVAKARDLLLKAGCTYGLCTAVSLELVDRVTDLLTRDASLARATPDRTYELWHPLHWAAYRANQRLCEILLTRGADPNASDQNLRRPLHVATNYHKVSQSGIVALLLQYQAAPNAKDQWGRTPLFGAAVFDQTDVLSMLLKQGADPNIRAANGRTPLHAVGSTQSNAPLAAKVATTNTLLKSGADPKIADQTGATPLHAAVAAPNADPEIIGALLAGGADPAAKDKTGRTPLQLAQLLGKQQIVALLLRPPPSR